MQKLLSQLAPFVLMGIAIVAFAFGIILLAYLFLFGALIGLILFVISWIKHKFFSTKTTVTKHQAKEGRIIDSDDWRKL